MFNVKHRLVNPYDDTEYSVGAIYLVVQNLPRSERFKVENIILIGLIPGPTEPSKTMNTYLELLVENFTKVLAFLIILFLDQQRYEQFFHVLSVICQLQERCVDFWLRVLQRDVQSAFMNLKMSLLAANLTILAMNARSGNLGTCKSTINVV